MTTHEDRFAEDLRAAVDGIEPPGDFAASWPARVAARKARRRTSRLVGVAAVLATAGLIGALVAVRDDPGGKTVVPGTVAPPTPVQPEPSVVPTGWSNLAPSPLGWRRDAGAAWTGSEYIVWGGEAIGGDRRLADGAAYDPRLDAWRPIAPSPLGPRADPVVVWTGYKLIVWGGTPEAVTTLPGRAENDGARYDPASDTWSEMAPFPHDGRAAGDAAIAWTGTELLVWGGGWKVDHGAAYNPETDTWRPLPAAPIEGRNLVAGVWTGEEMIVWGGAHFDGTNGRTFGRNEANGAAYNPETNTWKLLPKSPLAAAVVDAVWTGSEVLFSAGYSGDPTRDGVMAEAVGAAYDPDTDMWRQLDTMVQHPGTELVMAGDVPLAFAKGAVVDLRDGSEAMPGLGDIGTAAWTGIELFIHSIDAHGLMVYRPESKAPAPPPCAVPDAPEGWRFSPPAPRTFGAETAAVWTGSRYLVWLTPGGVLGDGSAYDPTSDTWAPVAAPPFQFSKPTHQLWTGSEVLLWNIDGGAAYNPATGSWRQLNTGVGEDDRVFWTGSEVLRWYSVDDGYGGAALLATGPDAMTWRTLPSFNGTSNSAVWTGAHFMVPDRAGGQPRVAMFDSGTEMWTTSSQSPYTTESSAAVWTGTEVVYFGGSHGAAYNPVTDAWRQLGETPQHPGTQAWWTGTHVLMLIKGGYYLYDPVTDEVSEKVQPGVMLSAGSDPVDGMMTFLAEVAGTDCAAQTVVATMGG